MGTSGRLVRQEMKECKHSIVVFVLFTEIAFIYPQNVWFDFNKIKVTKKIV